MIRRLNHSAVQRFFLTIFAVFLAIYLLSQVSGCASHQWSFGREIPVSITTTQARGTCANYGRELDVLAHSVSASVTVCVRNRTDTDGGTP